PVLISCRQATSGRLASSHSSSRVSRPLTPLTLKVAIFNRFHPAAAVRQIGHLPRRPRSQRTNGLELLDYLRDCDAVMSSQPLTQARNRRAAPRKAVRQTATVAYGDASRTVQTWDLGRDGMCLLSARPIAPGTRCTITF